MADPVFERYKEALKLGHVATFKGRPKEALERYREAARLAGHRPLPFVSMGSVLLQMGRTQEAIAAYDEALRRAPEDRQALSGKAAALTAAGKRADAAALVQHLAELDAADARRRAEEAASAQAEAWSGRPERLMLAAQEAERFGNVGAAIDAYVSAAGAYQQSDQLDAALDACQRALGLYLGAPSVHLQMARIYFRRGWNDRAVERMLLLDRLLTIEPDPATWAGLRELARLHQAADPRLSSMASA
jgi:tetratricopeptide (TPR) repeat protein